MASRFADLMRSLTISPAGGSAGMRHSAAGTNFGKDGKQEPVSPLRGIDSTESTELPFLRFAQCRLIRPSSALIVSPGDKRQDRKRDRDGQGNHMLIGSTMLDQRRTAYQAGGDLAQQPTMPVIRRSSRLLNTTELPPRNKG
jgi:hypothetical protein